MQQHLTKLYEGANVSGAVPNLIYIPILFDCDLTGVDVLTDAAVSGANAVFSLSKNGVNVPAAAVTINTGAKIGSVTGLDVALVKGDEIVLNLASGAVSSPLTLNLVTDDGIKAPNFRSVWNMATEYSPDDVVQAGGNSYIALTTNTNQPPEINADDWEIFVAKGEDGTNGTDGTDGADGSIILNGDTVPSNGLGNNGNYYFVTDAGGDDAGKWYEKENGIWVLKLDSLTTGGGATLPAGDLNASTNKIEKIQDREILLTPKPTTNITDNFGSTLFSEGIWREIAGTPADMALDNLSGQLTIGFSPTNTLTIDSGIETSAEINFIDKYCQAQLTQWVWTGNNLYFGIWNDASNYAYFNWRGNNDFRCVTNIAGAVTNNGTIVINPITNLYFRLLHDSVAGTIAFQTSANGISGWTTQRTVTGIFSMSAVRVRFTLAGGNGGAGFEKKFDNFSSTILSPDGMSDKSLWWWNATTEQFEDCSLAELKAALDALS